jgi:hypothetical protein
MRASKNGRSIGISVCVCVCADGQYIEGDEVTVCCMPGIYDLWLDFDNFLYP